mmetsp:Transcript_19910/g.40381  ORF Transcript_19910/g.40381 Transcript_19910/m.40381 type:complete len:349 (+) Transcript_19910:434-1480(+)
MVTMVCMTVGVMDTSFANSVHGFNDCLVRRSEYLISAEASPENVDGAISALTVKPQLALLHTDFSSAKSADDDQASVTNDQLSIAPTPVLSSDPTNDTSLPESPNPAMKSSSVEEPLQVNELDQGVDALLLLAACAQSSPKKPGAQGGGKKRSHDAISTSSLSDAETDQAAHSASPTPPPATKRTRSKNGGGSRRFAAPTGLDELSTAAAAVPQSELEGPVPGRGSYKCGRCGQPKKGHVCAVPAPTAGDDDATDAGGLPSATVGNVKARTAAAGQKGKVRGPRSKEGSRGGEAGRADGCAGSPAKRGGLGGNLKGPVPSNMACALFLAGCATAPIPHRPVTAVPQSC